MITTTVATAVQRRWAFRKRTVLPADAYGRQRCNVVLSICSVVHLCPVGCVLVREGNKNKQNFTVRTYKIGHIQRNPVNRLSIPSGKKTFESPPRDLQCSDRAQTSTTGSERPSCDDVVAGFWLKVLERRYKFQNRRKFHKYTYRDEMRLSVEFVTVGFLRICRHACCDGFPVSWRAGLRLKGHSDN